MRLRVRDLRRYLTLRDISTDACTEKEELVELVLQHMGVDLQEDEEDVEDSEEANSEAPPSALALPVDVAPAVPQPPALSVSTPQEESHSTNNSSGTSQVHTNKHTQAHPFCLMMTLMIMMCVDKQDCGDVASVSLLPLEKNERLLEVGYHSSCL